MESIIYNDDCFNKFASIPDKSVQLVLVDLPYGQTACKWDSLIDLDKMWIELKRIGRENCQYIFFCTTNFGIDLILSNRKWFRYDIVWEKIKSVGFLSANKQPLRKHEMIYIFSNDNNDDIDNSRNLEMREYAEKVYTYINKTPKQITDIMGNRKAEHFFYGTKSSQFGLPTNATYNKLIEHFKIDKMEGFIPFDKFKPFETIKMIYNPQKTEGKPYKTIGKGECGIYKKKRIGNDNKGDRFPVSILKFGNDKEKLHPTQKPVELCEWLIKTYSNEGDMVLDFCMGSGSTIIACINTNRNYIGIEKDKAIFLTAEKRINETLQQC
jgi:site-specific DNA-methyltransferase (adenine-specific)